MKLGFVSDSLGGMFFDDLLDHAQRMGISGIEVNSGGWSTAPHFNLDVMMSIEHEDVLLNSLEGLEKSVALLSGVMPVAASDYAPQDI